MPPTENGNAKPSPEEQIRTLYEHAESSTAEAFEQLVAKPSFGGVFARSMENIAAGAWGPRSARCTAVLTGVRRCEISGC
jgi:hypothetical protein